MCSRVLKVNYHFLSILLLGISASLWAVCDTKLLMPMIWLVLLCAFVLLRDPGEFQRFAKRFVKIGLTLLGISLLQIIFRRNGTVLLSIKNFPIVYEIGLREALLLWIRFMILFALAHIMAEVSVFNFLLFTDKIRLPLNLGLLLLMTIKLMPFIFSEARRSLWFLRFRGIDLRRLSIKNKIIALKQLLYSLLMRSIEYVFHTALALELRGYGSSAQVRIPRAYPLHTQDVCMIFFIGIVNLAGFLFR